MAVPKYTVVVVRPVFQADAPPVFEEVGEVAPTSIAWADLWQAEREAVVSAQTENLPEPIKRALREQLSDYVVNLETNDWEPVPPPRLELWIYRDTTRVFRGPWVSYSLRRESITINARDALYYLRGMDLTDDLDFRGANKDDQFVIAEALVTGGQQVGWDGSPFPYSDYGLFCDYESSGVVRERFYSKAEINNVHERLFQLANLGGHEEGDEAENEKGFDVWFDPEADVIRFALRRGIDRSDTVILEDAGALDIGVDVDLTTESVISVASGISPATVEDPAEATPMWVDANTDIAETWGAVHRKTSYELSGTDVETKLHNRNLRLLRWASSPSVSTRLTSFPVAGAEAMDFEAGDTVLVTFNLGFGTLAQRRRVAAKRVTVGQNGGENISVEFLPPGWSSEDEGDPDA